MQRPKMASELRTEGIPGGYPRLRRLRPLLRYADRQPFLPAADEACIVRCRRIWGGITKPIALVPGNFVSGEEGIFLFWQPVVM